MKITRVSQNCIKLIEQFECGGNASKYLKAYLCPAGVWTIGIGTTVYPNGKKVKEGDAITLKQAYEYLHHDLKETELRVDSFTTDLVNQNQFDALVSFTYNVGIGNFKTSTLLKKVNKNPADTNIRREFPKWKYDSKGKIRSGLIKRRAAEVDLYFKTL